MPVDSGRRFLDYMRNKDIVKLDEDLTNYMTRLLEADPILNQTA